MEVFIRTTILGLVTGSIYAMSATGLVLTFKTSGILNLGYGALAMFTTLIHWQFTIQLGMPTWLSTVVVVLLVAPMIGVFLDTQLFRRLEGQPVVIGLMATVGLIVLLQGIVLNIWGAESRELPSLFPQRPIAIPGGGTVGLDALLVLGMSAAAAALLGAMLKFTRLGIAFRAVVDNRPIAGLMAVNTGFVSAMAWALGTSFAALSGILLAPRLLLLDPIIFPAIIISFVLGAAMVGYLRSLPMAYAGGLIIGLIQAYLVQYTSFSGILANVGDAAPFVLMSLLVLLAPRAVRRAGLGTSFMVRTRELATSTSQRARVGAGVALFAFLALVPVFTRSISWKLSFVGGMAQSIVFLSIVILTGYSGQISLGHTAFMGLAAFSTAHLAAISGMPTWASFLLGVLAAVPAGALIGIVAVRLHGIFLALMTLALAFMAQELFFQEPSVSGPEGVLAVPRPTGFEGNDAFFYLVLGSLLACVLLATNLPTGRTGRILAAVRDSETATRSLGINVFKYKVIIFSMSAGMAALGGILGAMQPGQVARLDFIPFFSIVYVTVAVLGGIFHIGGAIAAGLFFGLFQQVFRDVPAVLDFQLILFGLGATLALAKNPEGMFGEMRRGAHAILGMLGRRRGGSAGPEPLPVAGGQE